MKLQFLWIWLGLPEVVSDKKNNSYGQPKPCLDPILRLKRLKRGNAEEKQKDGEVCTEFDLHKSLLFAQGHPMPAIEDTL